MTTRKHFLVGILSEVCMREQMAVFRSGSRNQFAIAVNSEVPR